MPSSDAQIEIGTDDPFVHLLESTGAVGLWSWNLATNKIYWSESMWWLLGFDRDTHTPSFTLFDSRVHPDDLTMVAEARSLTATAFYPKPFRFLRPDGTLRWLEARRALIYGEGGQPIRMRGIFLDVTAREEAQRALQRDRRYILTLARQLGMFLWRIGPDGELNRATWLEWYKDLESPVFTEDPFLRFHPEDRNAARVAWRSATAIAGPCRGVGRMRVSDGRYLTHYLAAAPQHEADDPTPCWVGLAVAIELQDISAAEIEAIPGHLIRAGRALLDWSADDLARLAGVSASTIRRIEDGTAGRLRGDGRATVYRALIKGGVEFIKGFDGRIALTGTPAGKTAQ